MLRHGTAGIETKGALPLHSSHSLTIVPTMPPDAITEGFLGSLLAGLCTGLGALFVFVRRDWSTRSQVVLLASAAGVMLAATIFSLLLPAIAAAQTSGYSKLSAHAQVCVAVVLGAAGIWLVHRLVPHEHFTKGREGGPLRLGRHWLFIIAITLHNFPEGLSVGVATGAPQDVGLAVAVGIGLQNLPEGLAVAAALIQGGASRIRAFLIALGTGMVEPIGGLLGATAVSLVDSLLPWALGSAAGAMLFVVSGEIIPETHAQGHEQLATFSLVLGFVGMVLVAGAFG